MEGALWILVFTIAVGIVLYLFELRHRCKSPAHTVEPEATDLPDGTDKSGKAIVDTSAKEAADDTDGHESGGVCCGMHLVCEKDSLSPVSSEIEYYDDEELDRFMGREADTYSPDEIEEFQDILMTLRPQDAAGWARSITQRRINLPPVVRDELLMIVNEERARNR